MNRKRMAGLALALAIPALVAVPSALADVTQVRTPVTFTLSGCTSLPAGLTVNGSGEGFLVINSRVDQNGFTHIERNDLVTGTATDSNGATYVFNYHNHASFDIPPAGFPFSATTTDHFNLVGNGQVNQLEVHFVATVNFTSPTTVIFNFINVHGNPMTCDPI
jgi:hypothetical protein